MCVRNATRSSYQKAIASNKLVTVGMKSFGCAEIFWNADTGVLVLVFDDPDDFDNNDNSPDTSEEEYLAVIHETT